METTTSTYAWVENDEITNIIIWDGIEKYNPGREIELFELPSDTNINIGWKRIDGVWTAPPEPLPLIFPEQI